MLFENKFEIWGNLKYYFLVILKQNMKKEKNFDMKWKYKQKLDLQNHVQKLNAVFKSPGT